MILLSGALGHELNLLLGISGLIVVFGLILKRINQPYIIAYIMTGVILGPHGFQMVTELETAEVIGELGLVILMFFIGMEISLKDFVSKWRVALFGTGMQVIFSIVLILLLGLYFDWSFKRVLLLGFIISISSSAVVIKLMEDNQLNKTKIGQNVISILLTQDILIVPMIILMSFLGGAEVSIQQILLQVVGGVLIVSFLIFLFKKQTIKLPFADKLKSDHELQVFASLIVCFGLALITSLFQLSAGLGAFVAGLFVHASPSTKWLHDSLHSFRVVLISVFFLSIGMLIDLTFFSEHWLTILLVVLGVYVSNHGINTISLRFLGSSWRESLYGGSLLAQIGEFSFVLASLGYHSAIISLFSYQLTIIVISVTIFISPFWALFAKNLWGVEVNKLPI
ncbi:MAG: cation:proton antiporter [Cytophagales bacterium]|nr:cation:proton antiporter [Cytophagales bacterium]